MYNYVLLYNLNGIQRIMRRRVCDPRLAARFHQSLLENGLRGSAGCVHLSAKAKTINTIIVKIILYRKHHAS